MVQARAECALKALLPCLSAINEEDGVSHWGAEGLDTKNSGLRRISQNACCCGLKLIIIFINSCVNNVSNLC